MITRFNTNRDATRQVIAGSLVLLLILAITPPALTLTTPKTPDRADIMTVYTIFYGCGVLLLLYCIYRYRHWGAQDDAYLLSKRTLAILRPGEPVRFIKPNQIIGLKSTGLRPILADQTRLQLPVITQKPGEPTLARQIVATWFGEDIVNETRRACLREFRPSSSISFSGILFVAVCLLISLGLAVADMWNEFARFSSGAFLVGNSLAVLYFFYAAYRVDNFFYLLPSMSDARSPGPPRSRTRSTIHRFPEQRPSVLAYAGMSTLGLLMISVFIPMFTSALPFQFVDQYVRTIILLIAIDLVLVAVYILWRLYCTVLRGDAFVTVLLSHRTIAVLRPRRPTAYIKPRDCAALICGRNELVLRNGRTVKLVADEELDDERTICRSICRQWWPDSFGEDPAGIWAGISRPCRRKIAIGLGLVALGFALLVVDASPWGTAIAHHFILPGGILALYGYWTGLRGYGKIVKLRSATDAQQTEG